MTSTLNQISTHTCSNGFVIVSEPMGGVQSAAIRLLIPAGAVFEDIHNLGTSSVCAEMLMRGSQRMNSKEQADAFDHIGTLRNSSNSIRYIQLSASTIGYRVSEAMPMLFEMIRQPSMSEDSFVPACELAAQAVESLADDPQQRTALAARDRHVPAPFNRNTFGTLEGIRSLTHDSLKKWWGSQSLPSGSVLSVAGDIDSDTLFKQVESLISDWSGEMNQPTEQDEPVRGYAHIQDDSNQVQVMVVHDGPCEGHQDSMLEKLVIAVLSGGMSGRLFTEVREKRGLCYAVSSSYRADKDRGVVSNYVGTTPERAQESLDVLTSEILRIGEGNVTSDELNRAKTGFKSRLIFSGESTSARAGAIAADYLNLGRVRTLEEIIEQVDSVSLDALNSYLKRRKIGTTTIQTLGPDALTPPTVG
ncbi:MAG: pitrilysin family protein [Phycisphaerales bacterium]|nr:pitrilysin family protein [Phycisphaerales bacterium]